jgi:alpha-D-xyloside xylohydrolase
MQISGNSIEAGVGVGTVRITRVADGIFRVQYGRAPDVFDRPSFAVLPPGPEREEGGAGAITAAGLMLRTPRANAVLGPDGLVRFVDAAGRPVLAEGRRSMEPAEVQGETTYHVRQEWTADAEESLFGLGQHQYGLVDIKGQDIELWQHNTETAVPLLVSSKGYGILWDNPSYTKFGDPRDYAPIPADRVTGTGGNAGGWTRTGFSDAAMTQQVSQRVDTTLNNRGTGPGTPGFTAPAPAGGRAAGGGPREQAVRWEGTITTDAAGPYKFQLYADGGVRMWIDGKLVVDHWRQNWLAMDDLVAAEWEANSRHTIKVEWVRDTGSYCTLNWKPAVAGEPGVHDSTSLWSQVGESVNYYFIYGGDGPGAIDRVLAGYRKLTGKAPLMPVWAFGLWQSRQRYDTQKASLDVVRGFRERKIPFDTIVQDWFYWKEDSWGSHEFDPARFPDPEGWIRDIHGLNARLMISVWPKFYPSTEHYKELAAKGYMYPVNPAEKDWVGRGYPYAFYDAFAPEAREIFWRQMNEKLFSKGVDAWWMDASEPDVNQPSPPTLARHQADIPKTAAGIGARVQNAYPLLNAQAIYEGQRTTSPDQRVFLLTRSGYAGLQRYAAASWSGDITSTWTAMHKQIAAGLGYSISGVPYWTMDSGGFSVPGKFSGRNVSPEAVDEWRELNTRWFEFATFVPLLRVHGEAPAREMWAFGGETSDAYKAQLKFDRLRYRMLPYVYSLAGHVTHEDGTFMRPLVMDFPADAEARRLTDQYMFGPAFMVSPVTQYKARTRPVYLPAGATWYDFWTGKEARASGRHEAEAPYDAMPVHVRAGSIVPFGPELQYTTEKKADPLTLYVYAGADGTFTLYEDDGLTYGYEKGAFARIPLRWNDAARTLTIGRREGSFPGMLEQRTIQVVFVSRDKPVPFAFEPAVDKTVHYTGEAVEVRP